MAWWFVLVVLAGKLCGIRGKLNLLSSSLSSEGDMMKVLSEIETRTRHV
jgi:hypothetical protein